MSDSGYVHMIFIVAGGWSLWGEFGSCSQTCGAGFHTRTRTCTNPEPQNGGADCVGDSIDPQGCLIDQDGKPIVLNLRISD